MNKIKAVIFDMDGVLIDSTKYTWMSHNKILKREGIHVDDKHIPKYLGMSLRDQLKMLKKDFGVKNHNLEEYSNEMWNHQKKIFGNKLKKEKNLIEIIKKIKERGFKLAVATSSSRDRAFEILKALGIKNFFDTIVTSEDVEKHKPNPDLFLKAAEKIKIDPKSCIVIEDAVNGIQAANRAGMFSVALMTEYHKRKEFNKASFVINNLKELEKILK